VAQGAAIVATNWRAVWTVFAGGLVAGAYMTKVAPALPLLRGELGLTLVESGLIATTFNVMGMLVGMLFGVLCDRFGHKQLSLAGLTVMAAGGVLGAASESFGTLLASRFIEGVGCILFIVAAPALMTGASASAHDRTRAIGLWTAYMPTGGSMGLLAAPWIMAAWGWRGFWMVLAAATVAITLPFARLVPRSRYGGISSLRLIGQSLAQKANLAMALLFAFYVAQWTSIMLWLPTFLIDEHGAAPRTAALATALFVLINAPGNIAGGWLIARGAGRQTLVVSAAIVAALCEIGMFSEALPGGVRFSLVLVFSLVTGLMPASVFTGVPVHAKSPQHIGTGNGIVMQASQIGQFFGPIALAWIASRFTAWNATLWPLLAFAGGAALCGLTIGHFERKLSRP
jgi:MFS family permease